MIKKIFLLTTVLISWALAGMTAKAAIIFQDDDFATIDSDGIILDSPGNAPGDVTIQFGGIIGETIKWSVSNNRFEISDDLDLGGSQLSSFLLENVTALPGGAGGLGSGGTGRTVQLTITDTVAPGCTVAPNCTPGSYTWDGSAWKILSGPVNTQYAQTITVAESGADFTSIKSAVDSITDASAVKPYLVQVYPGTYTEAPITLPDFVSVAGLGDFSNTIVTASSTTGTLFEMGLTSTIRYMTLQGASGSGGKCVRAAKASGAINIRLSNCETGILATGATTTFQAVTIVVNSGTFTDIIKVEAGAQVGMSTFTVAAATAANAIIATGTNTGLTLANAAIRSALVTNGIYLNDNAKATIGNVTVQLAQNGLRIGPTGTSTVNGSGGVITNNSVYNILAETASAKIYYSGLVANKNKFNIPVGATRVITFNDDTAGDEALNILGELNVGIPEHPTESLFGEGDSYTSGMLVYTFNGTTYTDVTSAAQDSTGTTFTFPGTGVNNAIYISSDRKDALGNFVKFGGYRLLTSTVAASGGNIVHEYWNGSSWSEFNVMCLHATLLYRYDESCFLRASSDEYTIFNDLMKDSWALNDPPTTGTNRYWIRIRIETAVTTAPVFEQLKINPNSMQVNKDGTLTFLGDARHRRTFITGPEMVFYGQGSNIPANTAFTIGSGATAWTLERLRSAFNGTGGSIEEVSGSIALPHGIDTSNGLKARIYWKKSNNNAGNAEWKLDYLISGPQNVPATDGSNIATAPRAASEDIDGVTSTTVQTTAAGPSTADQVILSDFTTDINISGHYEGDVLFLRLYRDPTDANDTYTSDAVMVGFEVSGVFWTLGEKL